MTNAIPPSLAAPLGVRRPGALRILGLDPGLRRTGWGVITVEGTRIAHVAHGVVAPAVDAPFAERLLHLFDAISEVIVAHEPSEAAVEETFMNNNAASALKLGHARACALLAPARAGLSVAEYGNSVIKKAVVGTGAADKGQVGFMIARLLPTAGKTTADAADALAVAIAHAHVRTARAAYGRVA
ncbi:crossover junction endodeoxyribonuclease RuvC [Phenylobacterium sp.]|jgi:crossover junction endodeoxyribonuclease RuvC|uniref:crossover junction endodeoxyribonuclease RuvC n=1 Tax=Phenylobacterium sp. TaxID=1871053 RepID=UPI002F93D959